MKPYILIGGGGHAAVVYELLLSMGASVKGIVANEPLSSRWQGVPLLGDDDWLAAQAPGAYALALGVGSIAPAFLREKLFVRFSELGFAFPPLRHSSAIVSPSATIAEGAQIHAGVILQAGVRIGKNAIVNTGARIDHDGSVGDHAHVAPGCVFSGNVDVGPLAFVGVGSVVRQGVRIGREALVGAGSVVISDVDERRTVYGNPAKSHDR